MAESLKNISLEKNKNLLYNNMTKLRESNFKYLLSIARKAKGEATAKVNEITTLYKLSKISNITTAENIIRKLINNNTEKEEKKILKQYNKLISKYESNQPLNIRLRQAKNKQYYILDVIFYVKDEGKNKQINILSFNVNISEELILECYRVLLEKPKKLYNNLIKILKQNLDIAQIFVEYAITAIYILSYTEDDRDNDGSFSSPYTKKYKNSNECISMYSKYITTNIDTKYDDFKKSIENKRYIYNECWINTLVDYYGDTLLSSDRSERYKITREKLLQILNKDEENITNGLKISEILPFFEKFKLILKVFNELGNLIYQYIPERPNKSEKRCYVQIKNDHVYTINNNIELLKLKNVCESKEDEIIINPPSSNYNTNKKEEIIKAYMIENINDIIKIIKDIDNNKNTYTITLIYKDNNLNKCCYDLIKAGYHPKIKFLGNRLTDIYCIFKNINIKIQTQDLIKDTFYGSICVNSAEIYNKMNEAMYNFNKSLFITSYKSFYNTNDINILNEYRTIANNGYNYSFNDNLIEIDINKAYTFQLSQISEIPVFNEFDTFENYNNNEIKDLSLYIVKTNIYNSFFNKKYNLVYGKFLKYFENLDIIAFKTPSEIKKVNYSKIIDTLYNTIISDDEKEDIYIKKHIANINIGLLEKGVNKKAESFLYKTKDEAYYYRNLLGGQLHLLQEIIETKTEDKREEESDDEYISPLDGGIKISNGKSIIKIKKNPYYILNIKSKTTLINGFRYIKELLMQYHNYKIYSDIKKLNDNYINVYSIKTDALTVNKNDINKIKELLNFSDDVGGWRISKDVDILYPSLELKVLKNKEIKINSNNVNIRLDLIDEYDNNEICEKIKEYKQIIIRAEYGGSGKSYACAYMKNLNYNVLFVSPTNVLCKELSKSYDIKAVSLNKFFGFKIDGDTDKFNKFDSSSYDCIIFDEIYFYSISNLLKVYNYINNNKNKIILATGDVDQLEPIEDINNVKNYDEYKTECINKIFKYEIFLKENKRLSTDEDKEKLKNLKHDILKTDISVLNIINKYNLKTTNKIITDNNIAYTNKRCSIVSKQVRKKLNKKNDYEINEKLTCIKYFIHKGIKVNKNYEYIIIDIENNYITLKDEDENKLKLDLEFIKEHFIFSYCNTCHSRQGSTIKDTITIHEWNHIHASRKWLYTAITRTTHFDNVYFMVY